MITLIFLFIMTLLCVMDSDEVIINTKMQAAMQRDFMVFSRAQMGIEQIRLAMQGEKMILPDSPILLKTTIQLIKTDRCGNQTVNIESEAHDQFETVVLNSRDIFATVPIQKKCRKISPHQVLWWVK
ncbi:MAG: hypothetical protein ACD_42C00367G0001 [uncultured bacterium]|nr:MAG: hypothetical protein ACD_42C00367G0001 [uncultured bacterium]